MPLLVPQPLVAFDKMLEYINKMEGVDAILQEYGSLAGKPPNRLLLWGYISHKKLRIKAWYDDFKAQYGRIKAWYDYIKARNSSLYHDTDYRHAYSTS